MSIYILAQDITAHVCMFNLRFSSSAKPRKATKWQIVRFSTKTATVLKSKKALSLVHGERDRDIAI
jgi:hypothetical protein